VLAPPASPVGLRGGLCLDFSPEEDARLSAEDRKELKKSQFCGPKKSFPVPDCAHAVAARKLLDKAKLSSSSKDKIMVSIDRKAKTLKCDADASSNDDLDTDCTTCDNGDENQQLTKLSDAELKSKFDDFKTEMLSRNLMDDTSCSDEKEQIEILNSQVESAYEEIDELSQSHAELQDEFKAQLAEKVVDLKILSGDNVEDRDASVKEHLERTTESLKDSVTDLNTKVNLKSVVAKLNDGISGEPTGQVDNPVLQDTKNENNPDSVNSKKKRKDDLQTVYDSYDWICETYGKKQADAYIEECRQKGLISR